MALKIVPKIFREFPEVRAAMTLRGNSSTPYGFNLSAHIGDDPERVEANRRKAAEMLGFRPDHLAVQKQVHGNTIVEVDDGYQLGESDALYTSQNGWLLGISVADCVPVLLYDPDAGVVAGVHSGWRGTLAGIGSAAVEQISAAAGVRPENLRAWIGPSAGVCCYEVGPDVAELFPAVHSCALENGKFLFDNRGAVLAGLLGAGLREQHIEVDMRCSICDERFHSYRRDGGRSGRMYALIGMVDERSP